MFIAYMFVHCHVICNSPVYGGNKEYLLTYLVKVIVMVKARGYRLELVLGLGLDVRVRVRGMGLRLVLARIQ